MSDEKALTVIEHQQVIFYGDEIQAVVIEGGQIFVPIRPICDFLGLSWSGQRERINRDPVLSEELSGVRVTRTPEKGGAQEMLSLPLDYLNGWLFGINANRVKAELKEKVIRYQRDCYRVLSQAFLDRSLPAETTPTMAALVHVREMGRAIMQMAEEQMEFERRLTTTEDRVDQSTIVVGDLTQRVTTLEQRLSPGQSVSEEQASQISQAVKTVAIILTKQSGSSQFGAVYGELYRKFGITSYKMLPAGRFDDAMKFLTDWHSSLVGEEPF